MRSMEQLLNTSDVKKVASLINADICALPLQNAPGIRAIRRDYSRKLKQADPEYILNLARELIVTHGHRWVAYELLQNHKDILNCIGPIELEELGQGINSWSSVDSFARTLSGPAWLKREELDGLIYKWGQSKDRWWRRAALVSTVALNKRSKGGGGDIPRTLNVCRMLVNDHDDTVVKAMSWALRELVVHDPKAVQEFLSEQDDVLAARVKREVNNKLTTGLKNPRRK